jgi:hypothetical protein
VTFLASQSESAFVKTLSRFIAWAMKLLRCLNWLILSLFSYLSVVTGQLPLPLLIRYPDCIAIFEKTCSGYHHAIAWLQTASNLHISIIDNFPYFYLSRLHFAFTR